MKTSAESLNQLGIDLQEEGRHLDAEQAYLRATQADPSWSVPWYNLGLVYKLLGRWSDSIRCNERAVNLSPEDGDAWWNLGIAATATADWALARRAWRECGVEVPDGVGELRLNYGPVPIRLNGSTDGEVVWCDRIDPARAIIQNIPFPQSGYREGDLVLHDGAPNGFRIWNERKYPVFDALQVLVPSDKSTYESTVVAGGEAALSDLQQLASERGIPMEDWEGVNWICAQCSEGTPHAEHDRTPGPWKTERRIAFSSRAEAEISQLLDEWVRRSPNVRVLSIRCTSAA